LTHFAFRRLSYKTQVDRQIARSNSLLGNGGILKQGCNNEIHLILTLASFSDSKPEQFWQNATFVAQIFTALFGLNDLRSLK